MFCVTILTHDFDVLNENFLLKTGKEINSQLTYPPPLFNVLKFIKIEEWMAKADSDNDGVLTYEEFRQSLQLRELEMQLGS